MPLPGDVDVVLASELMEAGRAVQRGLVTPRPHDADRVDAPRLLDRREDRAGRRPRRQRRAARACRRGGQALRPLRHGAGRRGRRQRDQRGAVRRARRHRRAAVQPRAVRGDDRARRRRRQAEPEGLRRGLRAARKARRRRADGAASPVAPHARAAAARIRAVRALLERVQRDFPADAHAVLLEGVRRLDRLPGPRLRRPLPRPPGARSRALPGERRRTPAARDRAPPRAVDDLRGHDPRRRAEDARHALRARARRGARAAATSCSRSTSTCTRACRRSARRCPAALGRWLDGLGLAAPPGRALDAQGPRRHDQLAARLPDALRAWPA